MGQYWGVSGLMVQRPPSWQDESITLKQFYPIVAAMEVWATRLANKRTALHNDNMVIMRIQTKTTSRDSKIMALVRKLVIRCMLCNLQFRVVHISGYQSVQADVLSRLQVETLHQHMGQQATCAIAGRHPAMQLVSGLKRLLNGKSIMGRLYKGNRCLRQIS